MSLKYSVWQKVLKCFILPWTSLKRVSNTKGAYTCVKALPPKTPNAFVRVSPNALIRVSPNASNESDGARFARLPVLASRTFFNRLNLYSYLNTDSCLNSNSCPNTDSCLNTD